MTDENRLQESKKGFRELYKRQGNLTAEEIEELLDYEYVGGKLETVYAQVRRYYLKLKDERPQRAEEFIQEVEPLLKKEAQTEQEIHDLSDAIAKYVNGAVIHPELTPEMNTETTK
jgi:hypothetical protein